MVDGLARGTSVMQKTCAPFHAMIRRWVCEGVLDDPYHEFFVAADTSADASELWRRGYSIREAMLPQFVGKELAEKVCCAFALLMKG